MQWQVFSIVTCVTGSKYRKKPPWLGYVHLTRPHNNLSPLHWEAFFYYK